MKECDVEGWSNMMTSIVRAKSFDKEFYLQKAKVISSDYCPYLIK